MQSMARKGGGMSKIKVEKADKKKLEALKIDSWSPWECEPSTFDWEYTDDETCYVSEGRAKVTTAEEEVEFGKGDIVVFPKGLKCKWHVIEKIKKVYKFG